MHQVGVARLAHRSTPLSLIFSSENFGEIEVVIDREALDLAAIVAFERSIRGLAAESYYCGRISMHGRIGVGNILGVGNHFGFVEHDQWDEIAQIAMQQALQDPRAREKVNMRLRNLFENFVYDQRKARYDGRIGVNNQLSMEATSMRRLLGLTTLLNYANASSDSVIDQWVEDRIGTALNKVFDIGN